MLVAHPLITLASYCGYSVWYNMERMTEAPFTNRELKRYFDDFADRLRQTQEETRESNKLLRDSIEASRREDNARFLEVEKGLIALQLKHENHTVKVGAVVFIVSAFVSALVVGIANRIF